MHDKARRQIEVMLKYYNFFCSWHDMPVMLFFGAKEIIL